MPLTWKHEYFRLSPTWLSHLCPLYVALANREHRNNQSCSLTHFWKHCKYFIDYKSVLFIRFTFPGTENTCLKEYVEIPQRGQLRTNPSSTKPRSDDDDRMWSSDDDHRNLKLIPHLACRHPSKIWPSTMTEAAFRESDIFLWGISCLEDRHWIHFVNHSMRCKLMERK